MTTSTNASTRAAWKSALRPLLACAALFFSVCCAHAEPEPAAGPSTQDNRVLQEQYGGVVVNQTITVAGQDFYQYFVASWRDRPLSERYAISVHERPSARWGTQVWIEYAQRKIFFSQLPSSRARIKTVSEDAAELVHQRVVDAEVQRLFFRETDVGADEF